MDVENFSYQMYLIISGTKGNFNNNFPVCTIMATFLYSNSVLTSMLILLLFEIYGVSFLGDSLNKQPSTNILVK